MTLAAAANEGIHDQGALLHNTDIMGNMIADLLQGEFSVRMLDLIADKERLKEELNSNKQFETICRHFLIVVLLASAGGGCRSDAILNMTHKQWAHDHDVSLEKPDEPIIIHVKHHKMMQQGLVIFTIQNKKVASALYN